MGFLIMLGMIGSCLKDPEPDTDPLKFSATANVAAESLVRKQLVAPASARFSTRTRYREGDWYLLYVECDSQNQFGATLRSTWFVVVRLTADDSYKHHPQYAAQQCKACDETEAATMMQLNDWPTKSK